MPDTRPTITGTIRNTRHRIIGREIDIVPRRIVEETSIPIAGISDMIAGTGRGIGDAAAITAGIEPRP